MGLLIDLPCNQPPASLTRITWQLVKRHTPLHSSLSLLLVQLGTVLAWASHGYKYYSTNTVCAQSLREIWDMRPLIFLVDLTREWPLSIFYLDTREYWEEEEERSFIVSQLQLRIKLCHTARKTISYPHVWWKLYSIIIWAIKTIDAPRDVQDILKFALYMPTSTLFDIIVI